MTFIINESELRRALDSQIEPWEVPHMRNLPNEIDPILLNRRIADAVNETGDVTNAGHRAVLVVAIVGTVAVASALLGGWL